MALGDVNGDGKVDLALATHDSYGALTGQGTWRLDGADLIGDGKMDLPRAIVKAVRLVCCYEGKLVTTCIHDPFSAHRRYTLSMQVTFPPDLDDHLKILNWV